MPRIQRSTNSSPSRRSPRETRARRPAGGLFGRKPVRVSRTPPPVLVRNEAVAPPMAVRKSRPGQNRRRVDVALNVPGAEVRLPSLPVVRIGWRILSALLTLALAGLLYFLWTSPTFHIEKPRITGLVRIPEADINTVVDVSDEPVFAINTNKIHADLQQAFPEMKAITVEVKLPATLAISVTERTPVIDWKMEDQEKWVDAEGIAFPPRGEVSGLIVVEGPSPYGPIDTAAAAKAAKEGKPLQFMSPVLVEAIQTLSTIAPQGTPIVYDKERGLGWKDERGWQAYFGMDLSDMDQKLKVYQALVDRLEQDGNTPSLISVEQVHAPYYRLEH